MPERLWTGSDPFSGPAGTMEGLFAGQLGPARGPVPGGMSRGPSVDVLECGPCYIRVRGAHDPQTARTSTGSRSAEGKSAGAGSDGARSRGFNRVTAQEAKAEATRRGWSRIVACGIAAAWLASLVGPPLLLIRMRDAWLTRLEEPRAQAAWEEFREDMRRQSGRDGPVQRKVPRSQEPPARVWLRDHMPLAVAAWVLFAGLLGGFLCLLAVGVIAPASGRRHRGDPSGSTPEDQPSRDGDGQEQDDGDAENADEREHGRLDSRTGA